MSVDDLRAGKLEQSCPDCGRWEAAGSYCTGCRRPMGPADWYINTRGMTGESVRRQNRRIRKLLRLAGGDERSATAEQRSAHALAERLHGGPLLWTDASAVERVRVAASEILR